jgi:hypothetical protein
MGRSTACKLPPQTPFQTVSERAKVDHLASPKMDVPLFDVAPILAADGWAHGVWQRLTNVTVPPLTTPGRGGLVLDEWRTSPSLAGSDTHVADAATKRTLADAVATMSAAGP